MKFWNRWKKTESVDELARFENHLSRNMPPVLPRPEFVDDLRQKLLHPIPAGVELVISQQKKYLQTGLVIAGGLMGGILLIVSGLRGIVSLVGMMVLLISWIRQNSQHSRSAA